MVTSCQMINVSGSQKLMSTSYFMLVTHLTSQNFTKHQHNTAEGTAAFRCCLHLCWQSSSTSEQKHLFPPSNSCYPSPTAIGAPHSVMPCHWCLRKFSFSKDQQVITWWCKVRTVGWMRQQCLSRICDDLSGAHTCVWLSTVTQVEYFIYFSCGMSSMKVVIQTSQCFNILIRVHCCPPG